MEVDFKLKVKLVKNEKVADLSRRQTPLVFSIPTLSKDVWGESVTSIWIASIVQVNDTEWAFVCFVFVTDSS